MAEFALMCPSEAELADAREAIEQILDLDDTGEVDLPPYLARLLAQLQELLAGAHSGSSRPSIEP